MIGTTMACSPAQRVSPFVTSSAERDGCVVATIWSGLDITSAPALRAELLSLLQPGASRLIIDLSAVQTADASGFAVLVAAGRRARLLGGWLRLASPAPEAARVFAATGLDRHLVLFATVADAITGRYPEAAPAGAQSGTAGHLTPIRPAAA